MTECATHSPTPWKVEVSVPNDPILPFVITTTCEDEWNVASVFGDVPQLPAEANAAFIVHAVNLHDEMVEALREMEAYLDSYIEELAEADIHAAYSKATLARLRTVLSKSTPTQKGE